VILTHNNRLEVSMEFLQKTDNQNINNSTSKLMLPLPLQPKAMLPCTVVQRHAIAA